MSTDTRRGSTNVEGSFGVLKQIDAGLLNVGYVDAGPADGEVVLLLHGWPYDIHSLAEVTPFLTSAGHRVIVSYLRGYGTTTFLSEETERPAVGARRGRDRALGCPRYPDGDRGGVSNIRPSPWPELDPILPS